MNDLIEYVADLEITQGRLAGEYFRPLPWQKLFMRRVFGPNVATAALSVGRGNGKTALLSGIACATLDGPLTVPRGETLIVASTFEQARIAFEHVVAFMGVRIFRDKDRWRVWDTAQGARVEDRLTGARVRVLGSDPRRAHGLAPCLILADEPTQWDPNKSDRMLAALRTAAGKQPSCRFVALGTRPAMEEHWFARMLAGGADYTQCHAADAEDDPFVGKTWRKANPSLSRMPDLAAAIKTEAKEAKTDPAALAMFKALRLNLGTFDTRREFLVAPDAWARAEGDLPRTGETARPVRRPHLVGDHDGQPAPPLVLVDGLRAAQRVAPDRAPPHPVCRRHLRHHPLEALEDRRPGAPQRAADQVRHGLGLSLAQRVRARLCLPGTRLPAIAEPGTPPPIRPDAPRHVSARPWPRS